MTRVQSMEMLDNMRIADEHEAILDRIRAGDQDGAALAFDSHLAHARELLAADLERSPGPRF